MQKQRLLKLADALEKNASNRKGVKFDLRAWGYNAIGAVRDAIFGSDPTIVFRRKKDVTLDCNTAACAFGYAAVSGLFKRQGLDFNVNGRFLIPVLGRREGFDAAMKLFNINAEEAEYLFDPDYYPEDKQTGANGERYVAKRIRKFVNAGSIPQKDREELGI